MSCLRVLMCTTHMLDAYRVQKRTWDPLKPELRMVGSHCVCAGNRTPSSEGAESAIDHWTWTISPEPAMVS